MSKGKDEAPAVTTFADHEVIVPPHKLRELAVIVPDHDPGPDPIEQAEEALAELAGEFDQWMREECDRLDAARRAAASGMTWERRQELFRAAHDIKGEASTFGYPLVAPVAASLCRLIEHTPEPGRIPLSLLDQHVDAVKAIVHGNAQGNAEEVGTMLASRLRQVTNEFLFSANKHRPDYLETVLAPALAPLAPGS